MYEAMFTGNFRCVIGSSIEDVSCSNLDHAWAGLDPTSLHKRRLSSRTLYAQS